MSIYTNRVQEIIAAMVAEGWEWQPAESGTKKAQSFREELAYRLRTTGRTEIKSVELEDGSQSSPIEVWRGTMTPVPVWFNG